MNAMSRLGIALMVLLALAGAASAFNVTIDKVEVNDVDLQPNSQNRLAEDRDNTLDIRIKLTAFEDTDNLEVSAFVSGYEYNDYDRISDTSHVFDADANVTYVKTLRIKLPEDVERDSYKLRVMVTDRNGQELVQNYNLQIEQKRHQSTVVDVMAFPDTVKAGSAVLTTVRVRNQGQRTEKDVRVEVSISSLGLSGVDYIDEIKAENEKETEEIYLRIPKCTRPGTYDMKVDVKYDRRHETATQTKTITVTEDETCAPKQEVKGPSTTITLGTQLESASAGQAALFPVTLTNTDRNSRSYSISVVGADDWATVQVMPSSTIVVDAGQSKAVTVSVTPKKGASAGPKVFTATVSAGSDVLQQLTLTTNVVKSSSGMRRALEVGFAVLIVILIVLGIAVAASRMKDKDPKGPQTYY